MYEGTLIDTYKVIAEIFVNSKWILFGEDPTRTEQFMVCTIPRNSQSHYAAYENAVVGEDYAEMMTEFLSRVADGVQRIKEERAERGVSPLSLTAADCISGSQQWDFNNALIVLRPECLDAPCRTADYQVVQAIGGFGCSPAAHGRAVMTVNLFTGDVCRYERSSVLGVLDTAKIPASLHAKMLASEWHRKA